MARNSTTRATPSGSHNLPTGIRVDVHIRNAEVPHRLDRNRGERLEDLEENDIAGAQRLAHESFGDRVRRLGLQRRVRFTHNAVSADLGQHAQPQLLGLLPPHHRLQVYTLPTCLYSPGPTAQL